MKNLKRVLVMIMTVAMMLSIAVFGTSAAFTDQSKVTNTEAVDMCVALNIINGYQDGSFGPTDTVTRAQLCKMISVALNGGTAPTLGTLATPTYSDIKGNWAEAYIEYCSSLKIVSGVGEGKFNPDATVTGTQAAKMLLVALGYEASAEGFNGSNWSVNINVRASDKALYDDLSIDPNAALTRDAAAQMIWNALQAKTVKYQYSLTSENGSLKNVQTREDESTTLMKKKYKATTVDDVIDANSDYSYAVLTNTNWDTTDKEYDYTISYYNASHAYKASVTVHSKTDYSNLFGMRVNAAYKDSNSNAFGIYSKESKVVYEGVLGDIAAYDSTNCKLDGTKFKFETRTSDNRLFAVAQNIYGTSYVPTQYVLTNSGDTSTANTTFLTGGALNYSMKAIDQDGNGKIDMIVYTPFQVAKATYVGSSSITLSVASGSGCTSLGITSAKFDDDTIYSGIKKDDYVKVVKEENTAGVQGNVITKLSNVSGVVKSTKSNKVQIDSTWYSLKNDLSYTSFNLNKTYTLYVLGTDAYYSDNTDSASRDDIAYVASVEAGGAGKVSGDQAKLYFADGTNSVVSVDDMYLANGTTTTTLANLADKLVTFEKDGSDYDLTLIGSANDCGYDGYVDAFANTTNQITASSDSKDGKFQYNTNYYAIADDAVVFIKYNGTSMKVVSGKVAKNYKAAITSATGGSSSTQVSSMLYDTKNGVNTVKVAQIVATNTSMPTSSGSTSNYAYVLSSPATVKLSDGDKYAQYDVWNGSKTVTVYEDDETASSSKAVKGGIITYSDVGNGHIDDVINMVTAQGSTTDATITNSSNRGYYAVAGVSGNDLYLTPAINNTTDAGKAVTSTKTSSYTPVITKDTIVLYVKSEKPEGSESGSVQQADDKTTSTYKTNVFAFDENTGSVSSPVYDGELELLVVDVGNEWTFAW